MQLITSHATGIVLIFKNLYGTLPAGAHTSQCRMPAEIRQIDAQAKTDFQQVLCPAFTSYGLLSYKLLTYHFMNMRSPVKPCHGSKPDDADNYLFVRTLLHCYMLLKIFSKIFQRTL